MQKRKKVDEMTTKSIDTTCKNAEEEQMKHVSLL